MEEILNKLIEQHELKLIEYTEQRNSMNEKMKFMQDHKFENELVFLKTQKDATTDIYYDYKSAISELRNILDSWNS